MVSFIYLARVLHPVRAVPVRESQPAEVLRVQGGAEGPEAAGMDHGNHGEPRSHQVKEIRNNNCVVYMYIW